MTIRETLRYIAGYIFGGTIFLFLIPFGLYKLSGYDNLWTDLDLLQSGAVRHVLSVCCLLPGVFWMIWSNIFLFKAGKGGPAEGMGVYVSPRTQRLVTTGPYRYCRNPMVLGALHIYLSIVIFLNSLTALGALLIFFLSGITYLKLSEEKRLEKDFGDEFLEYRRKVPMLFPGIRFNK
jgi:protein-S-isoprenylcysteine O-methyltransferase Ste14